MGQEIDLLVNYPKTKRDIDGRFESKTPEIRAIARKFGKEFFDGDRKNGYGGFYYNPKYWQPVIPDFVNYYKLSSSSKILDIGCAKGFMLFDFMQLIPGISVQGVDISEYAISQAPEEVRPYVQVANATNLPFPDDFFDLVISINTHHNLEGDDLIKGFHEINRVSKKNAFVVLDAYRNDQEKRAMESWNLTAKTIMHVNDWKAFFNLVNYQGDYYWFIP